MARSPLHEQRDHRLGPRRKVRLFRQEIEAALLELRPTLRAEDLVLVEKPGKREAADAEAALGEKMAAREIARVVVHNALYQWLDRGAGRRSGFVLAYFFSFSKEIGRVINTVTLA